MHMQRGESSKIRLPPKETDLLDGIAGIGFAIATDCNVNDAEVNRLDQVHWRTEIASLCVNMPGEPAPPLRSEGR